MGLNNTLTREKQPWGPALTTTRDTSAFHKQNEMRALTCTQIIQNDVHCFEAELESLLFFYYLRIENAEGNVLIAVYLFIYLYACYSENSKSV